MFGMPQEAIKLGAVQTVLPLSEIPHVLQKLCKPNSNIKPKPFNDKNNSNFN